MEKRRQALTKRLTGLIGIAFIFAGALYSLSSGKISEAAAAGPPAYQWHTFFGSVTGNEGGYKVARDGNGNIYVAGSSSATWNGPGGELPKHPYSGAQDILVLKLNSAGVYQWHTFYGSVGGDDTASNLAVDGNGNVYVAGESFNDFWRGDGNADPVNAFRGGREIMVLKLNGDGVYQWHTFHGTNNFDSAYGIVVDSEGNCYVAGYSNMEWGTPLHPHNIDSVPRQDIVVFKLNTNGVLQWNTFWGSAVLGGSDVAEGVDYAYGLARDNAGNLYVTGISYNTWQGGAGNNVAPLHAHSYAGGDPTFFGNYDIVVLKLDSAGAYQWHTFYGGPDLGRALFEQGDYANIPVSDVDGNVYVSGYSFSSWQGAGGANPLHPHSGDYDIMVLKLNGAGAYQWHTFYGSAQADFGYSPAVDVEGNLYLAATSSASWQGDNDTGPLHPYSGGADLTLLKLSGAGAYQWHTFYGSNLSDAGYGLMLDGPRDLIAVGASAASWQGDGGREPLHAYSGQSDVAILKFIQKSASTTVIVSSNNPARVGNPVTFTATISSGDPGTPTGSVTFRDGASDLGTAALDTSGQATLTTSALALGPHTLSAEYSGDSLFLGSNGQLTQQITSKQATTTSLSSSRNPAIWGSAVTFTATVGSGEPGIPTGSVIFRDGTTDLGIAALDISGKATLATSSLAQGSHSLSAEYGGDDLFSGSTGLLTQVIDLAKLYLPLLLKGL